MTISNVKKQHWFWWSLPYCFYPMHVFEIADKPTLKKLPKHCFLPLTREYKPLGFVGRTYPEVKYQDYLSNAVVFKSDPLTYKNIFLADARNDHPANALTPFLYMYSDLEDTRRDYFTRLGKLMGHIKYQMGAQDYYAYDKFGRVAGDYKNHLIEMAAEEGPSHGN